MRNLRDTIFYMKTNVLQDFHICISVPLKLQIDDAILGGCGQTCPGMPKETIKT